MIGLFREIIKNNCMKLHNFFRDLFAFKIVNFYKRYNLICNKNVLKTVYQDFYKINPLSLLMFSVLFINNNKTWGSVMANFRYRASKVKFSQNMSKKLQIFFLYISII